MNRNKASSPSLSLCMVNYNGARYLEESLGAILTQKEKFDEIILVDNASQDGSQEIVKDQFPTVKVIALDQNYGPATARNKGFEAATGERVLFVDNDVVLAPSCPDCLIRALNDHPNAAVAMPRLLYAHNQQMIQYDGADSHFLGLMMLHHTDHSVETTPTETRKIGSIVTACFLVDRSRWRGNQLFDDNFFFNYEDHDFGLRTRTLGHEILAVPSARAYHREGTVGLSFREGGSYASRRVFCLIRNRWQIILKNYALRTLLLLSPMLFLYEIFQLAGVIKKGWLGQWLKAFAWIGLRLGHLLRERRKVQKARRISDRAILQDGPIPFTKDLTKSPLEQRGKELLDNLANAYWQQVQRFI